MALVDAQVRSAIRDTLKALLDGWENQELRFERAPSDHSALWTVKLDPVEMPSEERVWVSAAFLVSESEEEAQVWFEAWGNLPV